MRETKNWYGEERGNVHINGVILFQAAGKGVLAHPEKIIVGKDMQERNLVVVGANYVEPGKALSGLNPSLKCMFSIR